MYKVEVSKDTPILSYVSWTNVRHSQTRVDLKNGIIHSCMNNILGNMNILISNMSQFAENTKHHTHATPSQATSQATVLLTICLNHVSENHG